ncbi:spexin prohormone 2-like isoform X1 [Xyrichtys novacula]|uniref:Spexin prohormone 2-like isoform X1 n=1 Tax=Xyrichtys novacula TaxID=13765 RepID=A0AAV1F850_XYRNO|nr:spexin prohormone 2-like isoform X1 [Xyrichtys novacula]
MKINLSVVWTCSLIILLVVESYQTQKQNVNWGPQSMMYLKGKHGRRFVLDDVNRVLKLRSLEHLQGWSSLLRGIRGLQTRDFSVPGNMMSSKRVLIQSLKKR